MAGLSEERYAQLIAGAPEATFFHTRVWARTVTAAFPQLVDETRTFAAAGQEHALPLFGWRRLGGLLTTRHSSFPFLYGGPVPSAPAAWQAAADLLARGPGSAVLIGNPFVLAGSGPGEAPPALAGQPAGWETTHVLTLPASVERYWDEVLDTRKRNDIRRLTRKGVVVETSRSDEDVQAVYALYHKRMATWQQRPGLVYPLELYRRELALGGDAVALYVARFAGRLIGGTFICRYNGIWHYQAGYFDHDVANLRPNVLVQERIIRDAITAGARLYDMLPSAGIASVEEFKESFGGVRTRFPRWEKRGLAHRLAGRLSAARSRGTRSAT
jgi:CelD/BcsL family acetyltransferase involved in cellulose biosynthesis